jgi:hypothetical protein
METQMLNIFESPPRRLNGVSKVAPSHLTITIFRPRRGNVGMQTTRFVHRYPRLLCQAITARLRSKRRQRLSCRFNLQEWHVNVE